jgi:hypothetical protein
LTGYVGLYRAAGGAVIRRYGDVKSGYDGGDDGGRWDAGDDIDGKQVAVASSPMFSSEYRKELVHVPALRVIGATGVNRSPFGRLSEPERETSRGRRFSRWAASRMPATRE